MKLFDMIVFIVLFNMVVGGLAPIFDVDVKTIENIDAEDYNESVAGLQKLSYGGGSANAGSDPSAFGLLTGAISALRIFLSSIMAILYIRGPLIAMGTPELIANPIQAGIWIMYAAFLFQVFTGRSLKNIE